MLASIASSAGNHDEPVHIELQLHQQFVAERVNQIGGVGGAAHVADFDPGACDIRQFYLDRLGVEARQLVFDGAQRLDHLASQKLLRSLLGLCNRQHRALPPTPARTLPETAAFPR